MKKTCAVILAAGKGTRMHSAAPKVLQRILGEPMLAYVLRAVKAAVNNEVFIVIGHGADSVQSAFSEESFVRQAEQKGTGDAVIRAMPAVKKGGFDSVLIVNGDAPLITADTLCSFVERAQSADVAFATIVLDEPGAYGRVVREPSGAVRAIVEAKDYSEDVYGRPSGEVNAGVYYVKTSVLEMLLPLLNCNNKSGEYYLTDIVTLAVEKSLSVVGVNCGADSGLFGVNTPFELSRSEDILREKRVEELLRAGVTVHLPQTVSVGPFSEVEAGAEIFGPCEIYGNSKISSGVKILSHCVLRNAIVSEYAEIKSFSHLEDVSVGAHAQVGPYARLRPGTVLEESSRVGNFVELKKSRLGAGAKANHLTYLGDAQIGSGTNIGAGTITCNYDGKNKFPTVIEENAFIGSNTALVAPVTVGKGATVGAGSVITKDIPDSMLGIGRAKQVNLSWKKK